jgi:hypothetical protein
MTQSKEILADWHLLGSSGGYRTLAATAGVTPAERANLEQFDPFRDLVGPAQEALRNSVCAFLHRLDSRRLAIRRILPDPTPDNYGRRSILVASLVLAASDYAMLAGVDAGREGSGLEGIVYRNVLWERIVSNRGRSAPPVTLTVPRRRGQWTIHDVDFLLFDAWLSARTGGKSRHVRIKRGSEPEARLLAIPSLLPKSQAAEFAWGIGIMRAVHPGTMASYLVPEFEPPDALDVPGLMHQPLAGQGRELMRRFPESAWHRDEDYRQLERSQREAEQQARNDRQDAETLRARLTEAENSRGAAERNANQFENELRGKNAYIGKLERDLNLAKTIGAFVTASIGLIVIVIILMQLVSKCTGPSQTPVPPEVESAGTSTGPQEADQGKAIALPTQPSKPAGSKASQSSSDNK